MFNLINIYTQTHSHKLSDGINTSIEPMPVAIYNKQLLLLYCSLRRTKFEEFSNDCRAPNEIFPHLS